MSGPKSIYNMKLFDDFDIDHRRSLTRMPGGWVYTDLSKALSTFIPYSTEFHPTHLAMQEKERLATMEYEAQTKKMMESQAKVNMELHKHRLQRMKGEK